MSKFMSVGEIVAHIKSGSLSLPVFQRGYVWGRDQVKELITSLYKGYPIGSLLFWKTAQLDSTYVRQNSVDSEQKQSYELILDGQQRITSLFGLMEGAPPEFFEGNENAFKNLYFHIPDETFSFDSVIIKDDDPTWCNVTEVLKNPVPAIQRYLTNKDVNLGIERINKLHLIRDVRIPIEEIDSNFDIDTIVDIFNKINSGGTKLSHGDLTLAKICGNWPLGREEIKKEVEVFHLIGFDNFDVEWFLRCVAVDVTGKPSFKDLADAPIDDIQLSVAEIPRQLEMIINQIGSRLGLDHSRVMGSKYAIPVILFCVKQLKSPTNQEWNRLMYWYLHSILWGRFNSSVESKIAQDINIFTESGIDGMIEQLLRQHHGGSSKITANDFDGWSRGARFYTLLYSLTRTKRAKDWGNGLELSHRLLGPHAALELHHIFPKALLYKQGYSKKQVNHLANFTFLTKDTNLAISNKKPSLYFPDYIAKQPGAVESHWIPNSPEDWEIENYEAFLRKRMELLAAAANEFLDDLKQSDEAVTLIELSKNGYDMTPRDPSFDDDDNDGNYQQFDDINKWLLEQSLPAGIINYEITNDEGEQLAVFDMAWPYGIQTGLSQKLAIILNDESMKIANNEGYKTFTSINEFKNFITKEYLK